MTLGFGVFRRRNLVVDLLVVVFGFGSWIAVNGLWVEVPLLVSELPEGWNLPSYLTIIIQVANLGPLSYGISKRMWPRTVNETSATFVMMSLGTAASFLLIFFWDHLAVVFGSPHSVAFLVLVFLVSLVDCTSTVVFLPFMAFFKEKYLVSLYLGEGFSGLLPGLVSLAQGVGGSSSSCDNNTLVDDNNNTAANHSSSSSSSPNFGLEVFFGFLTIMMSLSFTAFVLLRYLPALDSERSPGHRFPVESNKGVQESYHQDEETKVYTIETRSGTYGSDGGQDEVGGVSRETETEVVRPLSDSWYVFLLVIQAWICALDNSVLPAISTYYSLPYGNEVYHMSITLSTVSIPLCCFVAFWFAVTRLAAIVTVAAVITVLALYFFVLALMSPAPFLVGTAVGGTLVVIASMAFSGLVSYLKACLGKTFRARSKDALFACGVATQTGSLIGSLVMFVIVNFSNVFHA